MPVIARVLTNSPLIHEMLSGNNVEHLTRHVNECRDGDFSGLGCLRAALSLGLASLEEIGTTDEEMQRFYEVGKLKPDLEKAKELLAKVREGDLEHFKELADILDGGTVGSDDLGLETDEYIELVDRYNLFVGKRTVDECRDGNFSRFDNLANGWSKGYFTLDEAGTTAEEFAQFQRDRFIVPAKRYLEEARSGNFENIDELQELVNSGRVGADLEVSQEELDEVLKPYYRQACLRVLEECREGDLSHLDQMQAVIKDGPLTYEDLGTSKEEVESFGPRKSLEEMREIADDCRRGDFTNLPLLAVAVSLLPLSGDLSQEDVDSLDLDLEGWKRQDEINTGRELVETLRQRGGLSEAGDVDRELLTRFTAEELGLTEEEYLLLITPETLH